MATEVTTLPQSTAEITTYWVYFGDRLPTNVTISSATATHTPPPGGTVLTPTVSTALASTGYVRVTLGTPDATGEHLVRVVATLSDSDTPEVKLHIPVNW